MSNTTQAPADLGNFNAAELEDIMAEIESLEKEFQTTPLEAEMAAVDSANAETLENEDSLMASGAEESLVEGLEEELEKELEEVINQESVPLQDVIDLEVGAALKEHAGVLDSAAPESVEGAAQENILAFPQKKTTPITTSSMDQTGFSSGGVTMNWPMGPGVGGKFALTLNGMSITLEIKSADLICVTTSEGLSLMIPLKASDSSSLKVAA